MESSGSDEVNQPDDQRERYLSAKEIASLATAAIGLPATTASAIEILVD